MSCRFLGLIEEEWKTVYLYDSISFECRGLKSVSFASYQGMGIKYWGEKAKAQC